MEETRVLGLVGVLTCAAFTVAFSAERDVLNNWKKVVATNDFKKTLTDMKALQEEWPAVHSVKHTVNKNEESALLQTDYRSVARAFLQGLENYEKTLGEMSPETFCGNADALLDIRDRFLKNPSYINYFLVDSINRVIYVNLGERLAKVGDVPVCYDKIVGRLAEFRCDWSRMFEFTSREYDSDKMPVPEFKNLSFENKIDVIGKMVGQEQTFFFLPQDFYNVFGLRILEKRSLTALLSRLAVSDHTIGASLPALLSYRRRVTHFDPTDITSQLRDIFKDHPRLHPTLLYYDPPPVASVVKKIVEHIRSENWRQQLGFSDPPEFTKERIKRWEQEEAEREAQREAK